MTPHTQHRWIGFPQPSLRWRLTLWVIAVAAIVQTLLLSVFALYQHASIQSMADERLIARAQRIALGLQPRLADSVDDQLDNAIDQLDFALFDTFLVTLYNTDGNVIASNVDDAPSLPPAEVRRADPRILGPIPEPYFGSDTNKSSQAQGLRGVFLPFRGDDGQRYVLLLATHRSFIKQMTALLMTTVLLTLPVGVLAAAIGGWFVAGVAVEPLKDVREAASRLSPESLTQRVELHSHDSEISSLESELEHARQRIYAAFKAQERFMSNVSHELKTPISVLLTESETLQMDKAPAEMREFVASVREEMRRLGRLIDSFLMLTRVRDGKSVGISTGYLVNELVMDSASNCSRMAHQYNVRILPNLLENEDDLDVEVAGDPELLRTMLDNLIRNAIRFSPEQEPVVIACEREGGWVRLHVRDHGAGIDPKVIDHVFDRFAQAESEIRRGRGHGLGLEIAQGICELHHGRITVRNLDGGCQFSVTLPLLRPSPEADSGNDDQSISHACSTT